MSTCRVKAYENLSAPFREVRSPQTFRLVGAFVFEGEASDPIPLLEKLYSVGNRMSFDAADRAWPDNRRSLSVGDLAVVGRSRYVCDAAGWSRTALKHQLED